MENSHNINVYNQLKYFGINRDKEVPEFIDAFIGCYFKTQRRKRKTSRWKINQINKEIKFFGEHDKCSNVLRHLQEGVTELENILNNQNYKILNYDVYSAKINNIIFKGTSNGSCLGNFYIIGYVNL